MQGNEGQHGIGEDGLLSGDLSFAVTAAHELKAPLALLRQISLSLEGGIIVDPREQAKMVHQMVLVSERALRLTTDLTRASRLEDSLFELEPLNPQQVCEEVAHELTPLYKARGREIHVGSRFRPLLAVANRELLRRVIFNFSDNALHYAGDTPVEIRAGSLDMGNTVRVGVRDYGPPVPSDMWRRVQANMGRARQPLHARPQSSGLGLMIAGQFASAMGSQIGASRHHNGATFYIDMNASKQLRLL